MKGGNAVLSNVRYDHISFQQFFLRIITKSIIKIYSELHKAEYLIYHMNSTPDILPQQKEEHIGHIINQIRK